MVGVLQRARVRGAGTPVATALSAGALLALGIGYALLVPEGVPYDEPSHWGYVRFLAQHGELPVLGDPSVGYEAQMGPVGYVGQAVAVVLWELAGGPAGWADEFVRITNVVGLLLLFAVGRDVVRRVLPGTAEPALSVGVAVAVANPMVVAMATSVQNDSWSLLLVLVLLDLALREAPDRSWRWSVGLGAVAGLVLLSKISFAPAVAVILVWPIVRARRWAALVAVVQRLAVAGLVSGWWFLRSIALYDDLTGRSGVERLGVSFPPLGVGAGTPAHLASSVAAYLTVPVEYYRNLVAAPAAVEAGAVALVAVVVLAGSLLLWSRRSEPLVLVTAVGAASVAAWLATAVLVQAVAFRTAYGVLALWAVLAVAALTGAGAPQTRRAPLAVAVGALLLGLHVWTLSAVSGVVFPPGLALTG